MEKTIRILAVVLAVQVVLAVGLQFRGPGLSPAAEAGPLLTLSPDQVKTITVADSGDKRVKLRRTNDGWMLADGGFPADPDKVGQLLNQLTGLTSGDVVARTEGARERFKVASENFERRITLHREGQDPVRLYFGTSPGKDRIHARVEGEDAIQVVRFGTYDAPVQVADWQDQGVLQVPGNQIAGIEIDGLKLQRKESVEEAAKDRPSARWQAAQTPEGKILQQTAVQQLTQQLATLRFDEVLGEQKPTGYSWDQPLLQLSVQRKEADPVTFRLAKKTTNADKDESKTEYALKASSRKEYFSLATPTATQLLNAASREALLGAESGETSPDPSNGKTNEANASSSDS